MKKLLPLMLCTTLLLSACASAQPLTGKAKGYGGELTVSVTMEGDKITAVTVTDNKETPSIAGNALEKLPAAIVEKNSTDVDIVSGATYTSKAIIAAVNNAIDPVKYPYGAETAPSAGPSATDGETMGFGVSTLGRVGPGKDAQDVPIYSFNIVTANALFDKDGRIMDLFVDTLEVATPNYPGASMPTFGGFPGQGGYNYDEAHNGTITGKTPDTEQFFLDEVAAWKTKRERGDTYKMNAGTWAQEMDKFQEVFIGKTVDEIDAWFAAYCSDVNGRPLKADSQDAKDKEKYDKLPETDKAMLADVTTTATMSLNDSHGNILAAIRNAYDRRVAVRK